MDRPMAIPCVRMQTQKISAMGKGLKRVISLLKLLIEHERNVLVEVERFNVLLKTEQWKNGRLAR